MEYKEVKDSGERQQFDSGAVRDTQTGKGRFDLITPVALLRLAQHYENGAIKYGDSNWTQGIPLKRYIDSALRHINAYLKGDRSEDHIIAAAWNCTCIAHTEDMIFNGMLPPELLEGLPCYIPTSNMDSLTLNWWETANKLKDVYVKDN